MADALDLDPGDYPGTYKLIGGVPALDFVNLVSYRGTQRAHDWLEPATNLRRWADAAGSRAVAGADVETLRDLRELLARVFLAVADGGVPVPDDLDRVGTLAAHTWARRRLRFPAGANAATWTGPEPSLFDELTLDAVAILTSAEELRKVSACAECRWLFLDTSRNHSRRWCDPADCGNRARQRRHYQRHRSPGNAITARALGLGQRPRLPPLQPDAVDVFQTSRSGDV
jgi:predicted RNA-binding Zn ribbon-like protein